MIKEYIFITQSLAAAQTLQSLGLEGSGTAPRLLVMNQAKQHKYIQANNRNKLKQHTKHWTIEIKDLETGSTHYHDQNGTKNA